jgi:hypothetical protein
MEQAYYTLEQAKYMLQVSESTIRRGMKSGVIPRAKFSGKILIPAWFFKQALDGGAIKQASDI